MSRSTIDRRQFISTGLGIAATLAPARLRARGPNDRIGIGVIGCGSRGNYLLGETLAAAADRVDIVALADVWSVARDAMAKRVVSTGGRAAPKLFARYRDLLAMPQVDAVIIATPDFAHPGVLVDAVKAGKDAFVEKPLSARLEDAVTALDAVQDSSRIVQVGTQRRSSGRFRAAAEYSAFGCARPHLQDRDSMEPQRSELGAARGQRPGRRRRLGAVPDAPGATPVRPGPASQLAMVLRADHRARGAPWQPPDRRRPVVHGRPLAVERGRARRALHLEGRPRDQRHRGVRPRVPEGVAAHVLLAPWIRT